MNRRGGVGATPPARRCDRQHHAAVEQAGISGPNRTVAARARTRLAAVSTTSLPAASKAVVVSRGVFRATPARSKYASTAAVKSAIRSAGSTGREPAMVRKRQRPLTDLAWSSF
jgi:hypothetical protein